jgi:hypothetical protein
MTYFPRATQFEIENPGPCFSGDRRESEVAGRPQTVRPPLFYLPTITTWDGPDASELDRPLAAACCMLVIQPICEDMYQSMGLLEMAVSFNFGWTSRQLTNFTLFVACGV